MGCTSCRSSKRVGGATSCSGRTQRIKQLRQKLVTLYNITTDSVKRAEHRAMKLDVDTMLQNINNVCPTHADITLLTNYINNEYAQRSK